MKEIDFLQDLLQRVDFSGPAADRIRDRIIYHGAVHTRTDMAKRKIVEYRILWASSVHTLEAYVNEHLNAGWELRGQLKKGPRQVMVRYESEKEAPILPCPDM